MGLLKEMYDETQQKRPAFGFLQTVIQRFLFFVFFGGRARPGTKKTFYFRFLWFMTLVSILCPPLLLVTIPLWIIRACWPKKKQNMPQGNFQKGEGLAEGADDDI